MDKKNKAEHLKKIQDALDSATKKVIEETKALNSYLVVSDEKGNIKKIPAKDL